MVEDHDRDARRSDPRAFEAPEEDRLRADLYGLLARLLSAPPDAATLAGLSALEGGDGAIGAAVRALADAARTSDPTMATREYEALFVGLGRGELVPHGSFYLTGFLNEKPLASLRAEMRSIGVAATPSVKEPEDHIATLCETMAGLIRGAFGAPLELDGQKGFFERHLAPWAGHFFDDLAQAKAARLYAPVGAIGAAFVLIEREGFRLAAA